MADEMKYGAERKVQEGKHPEEAAIAQLQHLGPVLLRVFNQGNPDAMQRVLRMQQRLADQLELLRAAAEEGKEIEFEIPRLERQRAVMG